MKLILRIFSLTLLLLFPSLHLNAAPTKAVGKNAKAEPVKKIAPKFDRTTLKGQLLSGFYHTNTKKQTALLKKKIIKAGSKSVPALVEVMKKKVYPDKSRWLATLLLGRVMGKKSAPYIAKFMDHPSWVLRMAALKTLLALKQTKYGGYFAKLLKDKSFIVRTQALDNIRLLGLTKYAPHVWSMLYDKKNYYENKKTKISKRTNLIKSAVTAMGDLKFQKAKDPLFKMIQKKRYSDMFNEIEYSLEKITGKRSPKGNRQIKRMFWKKQGLAALSI
ncbi:MAG: HEAT repeat domain-containing protein [Bacteriovoracaceae bacterium]|nr:HEAT repeat domain-containing protein [Bacteriovoracaceae bacterium]